MIKRVTIFLLLLPFYLVGYVAGALVWCAVIAWAALTEAYFLGRGITTDA